MSNPDRRIVDGVNSAHQLALGISLGAIIGLIPKDSAFAWIAVLILVLSRGNLLCGILSAVAFSYVSPGFDGWFDHVGSQILSLSSLTEFWASCMEVPWLAWTRFNNSVVMGTVTLGAGLAVPLYLISRFFFRVWGLAIIDAFLALPVIRTFIGNAPLHESSSADPETVLS